ncbi:MAG: hypothetical protein Q9203_002574, partial [Teloschistes exilis]
FGLSNYDLGPNNIIVDRDFNALAVIDWDSVIAVPDAALYRFPYFMGVDCAIAGVRFAQVVEEVGKDQARNDCNQPNEWRTFLPTKASFFSREALAACRSMEQVTMRLDWVNQRWIRGLRWLSEHTEAAIAEFCCKDALYPSATEARRQD